MSKSLEQLIDLQIVGQFNGVILKDGDKIKYVRIEIASQEYWVKLPKELSQSFDPNLVVGSWLEITGTQSLDRKKGIVKIKASSFCKTNPPNISANLGVAIPISDNKQKKPACILICQKSDCWQHGGKEVYQHLERGLRDRGLSDRVQIQKTGCQKQCSQAPNLVIMPEKQKHRYVKPSQVDSLLNQYFGDRFN